MRTVQGSCSCSQGAREAFHVAPVSASLALDSHQRPPPVSPTQRAWEILAAARARSIYSACSMCLRMLLLSQHGRATAYRRRRAGRPSHTAGTLHPIPIVVFLMLSLRTVKLPLLAYWLSSPRPLHSPSTRGVLRRKTASSSHTRPACRLTLLTQWSPRRPAYLASPTQGSSSGSRRNPVADSLALALGHASKKCVLGHPWCPRVRRISPFSRVLSGRSGRSPTNQLCRALGKSFLSLGSCPTRHLQISWARVESKSPISGL
jgi:hypothetical protein